MTKGRLLRTAGRPRLKEAAEKVGTWQGQAGAKAPSFLDCLRPDSSRALIQNPVLTLSLEPFLFEDCGHQG
jgi:hypothetical protein